MTRVPASTRMAISGFPCHGLYRAGTAASPNDSACTALDPGIAQDLAGELTVHALEAGDDGNRPSGGTARRRERLGDDVAPGDPSSDDVDEHHLDPRVLEDEPAGSHDPIAPGGRRNVEKVRGRSAVELEDVHRGHRETGAVHHAADVTIERDVVEPVARPARACLRARARADPRYRDGGTGRCRRCSSWRRGRAARRRG